MILVYLAAEFVGTDVADLQAGGVDQTQVHESAELLSHHMENAVEFRLIGQLLEVIG